MLTQMDGQAHLHAKGEPGLDINICLDMNEEVFICVGLRGVTLNGLVDKRTIFVEVNSRQVNSDVVAFRQGYTCDEVRTEQMHDNNIYRQRPKQLRRRQK